MRRLLLLNALIFAVLAAAVALAYYGYSYTSDSGDRELRLMHELAKEKVLNIESLIDDNDRKLLREVQLDPPSDLRALYLATGAAVSSVFVLDDQHKLVPGFYVSTRPTEKEGTEFRDWFLAHVVPHLPLDTQPPNVRGHLYGLWNERPYLFSFMKRQSGDRTFYVVVEDDLNYLVGDVFPQFFAVSNSPRLYEVVDERGGPRFGTPLREAGDDTRVVEEPFVDTVDGWKLRVAERDLEGQSALRRRGVIDTILIGSAVFVILSGLVVLMLAMRRERRANELKSEFISNVSHELKTPLSIISMFGEMLATKRTKNAAQETEYAEIIWRESVRLGRLIDNVLDFAKIERGMGVYEFEEADVGDVVARAIELSDRRLAAGNMTLESDLESDLPPVRLDGNAFTLAVLNLIDNAIKYAADGKKIQLGLARAGSRILLSVRDFGPGIDPLEHESIFERFYRARAVRLAPIRGSGIGLALVRHIARAHGGDVSVESTPGSGAKFTIWLPIATPTET